ncbi:MAG: hypothetical protein ABI134_18685 [Byssovorax sp.]
MSIDAVALFRPKSPAALRPYLDLDEDSEESDGLYAEALDDGSVLVHTFQPYAAFEASPVEGRAWLAQFGADLPLVHDDARGLLFFPDTAEPQGRTYDAVVAEIASDGLWIPAAPLTAEEEQAREAIEPQGANAAMAGLDMEGLPAFAQQLFGSMNLGAAGAPGDMASMIATLQKQVMGALGMQGDELEGEGLDEDAFDALVLLVKRTTPLDVGEDPEQDVNELVTLVDGTAVIHTTAAVAEGEMVAVQLAEDHADWVSEHDDARGIPSFGARHLDALRGAASYDAALAALGDAVVFLQLQPESLDELRAEKKTELRKLFGEGV